ncbi:MAG: RHS repeat-associated core domain-containing protein [Anaerolineaceae bacterium]|nr:RHS repeat-associated core domain-containing protein [Anaerolineaceae bacterium]
MPTTYYASSSYVMEVDDTTTTVRKTYSAGSTSLAVRTIVNGTTETLNWMLSDHLGSSSITTTADGTWNSEIRYSAFGETRYSSGITPTDYRYTGQLQQKDVNLYYYNARYYDAALGRFVQADTIVPGAGNSKSYDRYAYVSNNPVRYTDPSGHAICLDPECSVVVHPQTDKLISRAGSLKTVAQAIVKDLGTVNDLEGMAIIAEVGASMYKTWDKLLPELSKVFNGTSPILPETALIEGALADRCAGVGREPHDCPTNTSYFLDSGFHEDFQDEHNQPFHVWANIAQTAYPYGNNAEFTQGRALGGWANFIHDPVQSWLNIEDGWGTSWEDYFLSEAGWEIGELITDQTIQPDELADTLRSQLGPDGPGSNGFVPLYNRKYGPLKGSPQ